MSNRAEILLSIYIFYWEIIMNLSVYFFVANAHLIFLDNLMLYYNATVICFTRNI